MTRPIVAGIIAEVLSGLSVEIVVEKVVDMVGKIKNNDPSVDDDAIVFGYTVVGELREQPEFWQNVFVVNNLVAAFLEAETMRVANPLFAAIPGLSQDDVRAVVQATDEMQLEAVPEVIERCNELYNKPQIRRFADVTGGNAWERKFVF
jgi:hypothetical protein